MYGIRPVDPPYMDYVGKLDLIRAILCINDHQGCLILNSGWMVIVQNVMEMTVDPVANLCHSRHRQM